MKFLMVRFYRVVTLMMRFHKIVTLMMRSIRQGPSDNKRWVLTPSVACVSMTCLFISSCAFATSLNIQTWKTSSGVLVYFVKNMRLPMVVIQTSFRAGSAYDGSEHGLAILTGSLLNQGSGKLSANQIADNFANVGAKFDVDVNQDKATVGLVAMTLKHSFNPAFQAYLHVLGAPSFPSVAFNRLKSQQLQGLKYRLQVPGAIASREFLKTVYGDTVYGYPVIGTKTGIESITTADVKRFYQTYYVRQNAVIAIEGGITKANAKVIGMDIAASLSSGKIADVPYSQERYSYDQMDTGIIALERHPDMAQPSSGSTQTIKMPIKQTTILMGLPALAVGDPDFYAAKVGSWILGGGQNSLLYRRVRSDNGLAYSVSAKFKSQMAPGPFIIQAQTRNQDSARTQLMIDNVLNDFLGAGPTRHQLALAKDHILGAYPMLFNSNAAIISALTKMAFYQLPLDYFEKYPDHIRQLNVSQVKKVMNTLINPNDMSTIMVTGK